VSAMDLVLIDTCVWVPFFNRPQSTEKKMVDALLDEDRAALIGPILAEILQGFRRDDRADWVASSLRGLHYLEVQWDDWRAAAHLGRRLIDRGHRLPLTDLTVAALAMRSDSAVYTSDPHFDLIQGLKRFDKDV
jgi:predicted nucleic acid-binding protein